MGSWMVFHIPSSRPISPPLYSIALSPVTITGRDILDAESPDGIVVALRENSRLHIRSDGV